MSRETQMPQTAPDVLRQTQRATTAETVERQRIVQPGGLVDSHPTRNNYAMVQGDYGHYVGRKPAVMQGSPGTSFGKGTYHSQVQASTIQHTAAVTVQPTARGQWMNSSFAGVTVMAGAKAIYTNCRFSGILDNSAGSAADVKCIGCFFDVPPVNVTVV
jgi:hypothetical protein